MTKQDIKKIADLARLKIAESELEPYASELSSILKYVGQLNEVSTDTIAASSQVTGLVNSLREDRVHECAIYEDLLSMAPQSENRKVMVKRVIA